LDGSEASLRATLDTLNYFHKISGLKINVEKTRAIRIGSHIKHCLEYTLIWNQDAFKILGIALSTNLERIIELNYNSVTKTIRNMLRLWNRRNVSLHGKVKIIKTLALSKLMYCLINIPRSPKSILQNINSVLFDIFPGAGKRDKVKRSIVIKKREEEGLGMIDVFIFDEAQRLSRVKRLFSNGNQKQKTVWKPGLDTDSMLNTGGFMDPKMISKVEKPS